MSKYTKGPYGINVIGERGAEVTAGPEALGISIAWCSTPMRASVDGSYSVGTEEAVANATLFSAAPDMLEALKAEVKVREAQRNRQAGLFHMTVEALNALWDDADSIASAAIAKAEGGE